MITVIVTYTVKENYVAQNLANIETFLTAFKELDQDKFRYSVFSKGDKKTFVHISMYADADIQKQLLNMPAFLAFQQQRDENLESEPTIQVLDAVGLSQPVFGIE
jgi:quinol monooxygenase YgiN